MNPTPLFGVIPFDGSLPIEMPFRTRSLSLILSWAMHEYTEGQRERARPILLEGTACLCRARKEPLNIGGSWNSHTHATNGMGMDGIGHLKTHLSADGHLRS